MAEWGVMMTADELAVAVEALDWMRSSYRMRDSYHVKMPAPYDSLRSKVEQVATFVVTDLESLHRDVRTDVWHRERIYVAQRTRETTE